MSCAAVWAWAAENGVLTPRHFLNAVPHVSFVRGADSGAGTNSRDSLRERTLPPGLITTSAGTSAVTSADDSWY